MVSKKKERKIYYSKTFVKNTFKFLFLQKFITKFNIVGHLLKLLLLVCITILSSTVLFYFMLLWYGDIPHSQIKIMLVWS